MRHVAIAIAVLLGSSGALLPTLTAAEWSTGIFVADSPGVQVQAARSPTALQHLVRISVVSQTESMIQWAVIRDWHLPYMPDGWDEIRWSWYFGAGIRGELRSSDLHERIYLAAPTGFEWRYRPFQSGIFMDVTAMSRLSPAAAPTHMTGEFTVGVRVQL